MNHDQTFLALVQNLINKATKKLMASLAEANTLSTIERRDIIARYTAVLEPNFIAWMSAAHIAVTTEVAHTITRENLREEIEGNHPGMLRRFAAAARAMPSDTDFVLVQKDVETIREFNAHLDGLKLLIMLAFFENFIATFMPYLADLAKRQGSDEVEYTDIHGGLDMIHTAGLYKAIEAEAIDGSRVVNTELFEGVTKLTSLLSSVVKRK